MRGRRPALLAAGAEEKPCVWLRSRLGPAPLVTRVSACGQDRRACQVTG